MDQEDLQSKGFFGVLSLSIRLIHSRRRLFLTLALSVLLPLAALSLSGRPIAARILNDGYYDDSSSSARHTRRAVGGLLFVLIYGVIYLSYLLLAAGASIHAAASAYAAKDSASLRRSLFRAAPRSWTRILGTSFWGFLFTLVYLLAGAFVLGLTVGIAKAASGSATPLWILAIILVCAVGAVYVAGAVYVTLLWHVAVAATVLEGTTGPGGSNATWGIAAIRKARGLVRGRVVTCGVLLLLFDGVIFVVEQICWNLTLYAYGVPLAARIAAGVAIFIALTGIFLLGVTVLTMLYLVLKAWHGEPVDQVSLAARLDACAGEYERMVRPYGGVGGDVQMMHQQQPV